MGKEAWARYGMNKARGMAQKQARFDTGAADGRAAALARVPCALAAVSACWLALTRRFARKVPGYMDGGSDTFVEMGRQLAAGK